MHTLIDEEGNMYVHTKGDFHNKKGVIREKDIKPGILKTNKETLFYCFPSTFQDQLAHITRGPAVMTPKDIGMILAYCDINKNTKIVEAGTGCGVLTSYLARISNYVTSYENNKKHYEIATKNLEQLNITATLKNKDIYEGIEETNIDLIILDLLEPANVLEHAKKALKQGGHIVAYVTNIIQAQTLVEASKKDYYHEKTLETIQRTWIIEGHKVRPEHLGLLHTGFLVFLRKI